MWILTHTQDGKSAGINADMDFRVSAAGCAPTDRAAISPARPKGVCGADADTIAARNFLRSVAAGSGCYIHVVENAVKQLEKAAKEKAPLKSGAALSRLAEALQITGRDDWEKAEKIAQAVKEDLYRPVDEKMELVEKNRLSGESGNLEKARHPSGRGQG